MIRLSRLALSLALTFFVVGQSQCLAQEAAEEPLPLTQSPSVKYVTTQPLSFAQQQARFEAEQRSMRLQWNNWIGYSPSRPNMNASYMSNGVQRYYIPSRALIVSAGYTRTWYW